VTKIKQIRFSGNGGGQQGSVDQNQQGSVDQERERNEDLMQRLAGLINSDSVAGIFLRFAGFSSFRHGDQTYLITPPMRPTNVDPGVNQGSQTDTDDEAAGTHQQQMGPQ
jgi:hypothetical protein